MVDFEKLRAKKVKEKVIDPVEIFRRSPKPSGINDLYTSQAEVLQAWFQRRTERDLVLKLHTGGGKTLVGLLMAQSTLDETREPVLYLAPTLQLVTQTIEKAKELGIQAVPYEKGQPLNDDFVNGKAIMICTYNALFNGRSKFGIRGAARLQNVSGIILDDAHAAFSVVRDVFTLEVSSNEERNRYDALAGLFRNAFKEIDRLGTFDDVLSGGEYSVLEIPYWSWHENIDAVREQLRTDAEKYALVWPLLRDNLHLCHALISKDSFTISPILPLVNLFPTFSEAARRIYMSATIADDSEIIRTFDARSSSVKNALTSRSLAGVSERMMLIPDLMKFTFESPKMVDRISKWVVKKKLGVVILVSSDKAASKWNDVGVVAAGSQQVESLVADLQNQKTYGPVIFANRYDGIDLPADSCRLLVMSGIPAGTSSYELFRASALYGGATIARMLAQRIEQGIGRGARGSGDHCVVLLVGSDLAGWIAKDANFLFLTSATRAQLEMGMEISKEIENLEGLRDTIERSLVRDKSWTQYHAETLAEQVIDEPSNELQLEQAGKERKSFDLWSDGYHDQAIVKMEKLAGELETIDPFICGWIEQLAARIADHWENRDRAEDLQRRAYFHNRNLLRPKVLPPYRPVYVPDVQAKAIAQQVEKYRVRRGFLQAFEDSATYLHASASANQFEQALSELAKTLGFSSDRHDVNGEGPDVLWLLPGKTGVVIEAKSRKKAKNPLTKSEHGQLLVAAEWFAEKYKGYKCVRVCVHPRNLATKAAVAGASHALTYENLARLVSDTRSVLSKICDSQISGKDLEVECARLLDRSSLGSDKIVDEYFVPFADSE